MDYFKFLPVEITLDILSRVPTESALECKLVCTNWKNHVHHPSFGKMHLLRLNHPAAVDSGNSSSIAVLFYDKKVYFIEYNNENHDSARLPIKRIRRIDLTSPILKPYFVGSYNGLICYSKGPYVCIFNPITREEVMLLNFKRDGTNYPYCDYWTTGFGYVSSTDEYKVVDIYTKETEFVEVYIYTLGSGKGWRNIGNFNFQSSQYWDPAIFANGALYWLDTQSKMIITFDLAEEKFIEHLSPPPLPQEAYCWLSRIGILDGFLYVAVYIFIPRGSDYFDIWLLKNKSVHQEMKEQEDHQLSVWSKEFRIGETGLFAVTKSDGILTYDGNYINVYDKKTSTTKKIVRFKELLRQVSPHQNTLVSLKELGEEDTKTMESVEREEERSPDYFFEQH